jgi:hypothetical protein
MKEFIKKLLRESLSMTIEDEYPGEIDQAKIIASNLGIELGDPFGFGAWGIVYSIKGNPSKLFKVTTDYLEMETTELLVGKKSEYIVNIYEALETDEGYMVIVMERIDPLSDDYKKSLVQFYLGVEGYFKEYPEFAKRQSGMELSLTERPPEDYYIGDILSHGINKNFELYLKNEFPHSIKTYHDLLNVWYESIEKYNIVPSDIRIDNMGLKNGHLAIFDIK